MVQKLKFHRQVGNMMLIEILTKSSPICIIVPGVVQNLNFKFNSATLSWNPPVYIPFPVAKYEVSYRMCDQSFNEVMESNTSNTSYTITGLQSDTCYIFIVLAYNEKGAGEEVHVNVTTLKLFHCICSLQTTINRQQDRDASV